MQGVEQRFIGETQYSNIPLFHYSSIPWFLELAVELEILESPGEEWDAFASRYTDLIFYQSLWSRVLRKGLGGQPLYFCLREGGEIVAGLPGVLLNFRIFKVLYASIPYGSLIGEKPHYPPFMELVERGIRRMGIDQVRITDSPFSEPYYPNGYGKVFSKCSLMDLGRFDGQKGLGGYKKYVRRDIRKAQRSGVTVRAGSSREDVRIFYELYLASMGRNRAVAKYPARWFHAIYEEMAEKGLGTFLFADFNQKAVAGAVLINSSTSTHYFHNGSLYEFLKFCPNELLIHSSLEIAFAEGKSFFDFMGSDPLDRPLIKFKEKWGSRSLDLCTYVKGYRPFRCWIWERGKAGASSRWGSGLLRLINRGRSGIWSRE